MDYRLYTGSCIYEGVAEEVREDLLESLRVAEDRWER